MRYSIFLLIVAFGCSKSNNTSFSNVKLSSLLKEGFEAKAFKGSCLKRMELSSETVMVRKNRLIFSKIRNNCEIKLSFDFKFVTDDVIALSHPRYIQPCDTKLENISKVGGQDYKIKMADKNTIDFYPILGGYCRSLKITKT